MENDAVFPRGNRCGFVPEVSTELPSRIDDHRFAGDGFRPSVSFAICVFDMQRGGLFERAMSLVRGAGRAEVSVERAASDKPCR